MLIEINRHGRKSGVQFLNQRRITCAVTQTKERRDHKTHPTTKPQTSCDHIKSEVKQWVKWVG